MEHKRPLDGGTYDWKKYTYSYTTGANQTTFQFMVMCKDVTTGMWIDDINISEEGNTANLVKNPGFEEITDPKAEFSVSTASFETN